MDDLFRSAGSDISYQRQVSSSLLACQLVAEGGAVAVIDVATVWRMLPNDALALVPLKPARWWSFGLFYMKNSRRSGYVSAFKEIVEDLMGEVSADKKWRRFIRPART